MIIRKQLCPSLSPLGRTQHRSCWEIPLTPAISALCFHRLGEVDRVWRAFPPHTWRWHFVLYELRNTHRGSQEGCLLPSAFNEPHRLTAETFTWGTTAGKARAAIYWTGPEGPKLMNFQVTNLLIQNKPNAVGARPTRHAWSPEVTCLIPMPVESKRIIPPNLFIRFG